MKIIDIINKWSTDEELRKQWGWTLIEIKPDILDLDISTQVGRETLEYLRAATTLLKLTDEPELRVTIYEAVSQQCDVWLHG